MRKKAKLKDLRRFHDCLQASVSHYIESEDGSERLMLKYYYNMKLLQKFIFENYQIYIFEDLNKFPLNLDESYIKYYGEILSKINTVPISNANVFMDGKYLIQKNKPVFINDEIFYEITLSPANENASKFNRITAYSKIRIQTKYAVKISVQDCYITIFGSKMKIKVINQYEISIRGCEFKNFGKIFNMACPIGSGYIEYKNLMKELTEQEIDLLDIVNFGNEDYENIKRKISTGAKVTHICELLDECRDIIINKYKGFNLISYLLYSFNNSIIKNQYEDEPCKKLSGLCLSWKCIQFEELPYVMSLRKHNPRTKDLFSCIAIERP